MQYTLTFAFILLIAGQAFAQEAHSQTAGAAPARPVFRVLFESVVEQRDGSTVTFRRVAPPMVAPQLQPAATAPAQPTTQETEVNEATVKESHMLAISASVHANGLTVLRWTCGESQRMQAVSNVDFRQLEGLNHLETAQVNYMLLLTAVPDDQALTDAEALAARSLPLNGSASAVLVSSGAAQSAANESALNAMESLLDFFDSHREDLVQFQAQRKAVLAAREQAARNAPTTKNSVTNFWPLQPAQRAVILENNEREKGSEEP